jgi:predicted ester cyclase
MAATNREVKISGITITRIRNGQIVEGWDNWDRLGPMRQIGPAESSQAA